ncbi:MAG: Cdc6/Cdc18 family protein [Candidatus Nanohalobium sp.]
MGEQGSIITDARVLTADYLPNKMVHREGERQEIARNLKPLVEGGNPENMLLYGPPGTGKTAMARYVVEELKEEVFANSSYVNCFSQKSRFEIFYELLGQKLTTPRDGTSTEKIVDMFEERVRKEPTVMIIDEVDQITDDEVLYELSRFHNVGMIFIANDQKVFSHFEDRVRSRLSGMRRIHFRRYDRKELKDILEARRKHGLKKDVVSDEQLEEIAAKAGGDARIALNTLRFAAREAERQEKGEITDGIIDESVSEAFDENRLESLDRLNEHQKTAYSILQEEGEMQIGELYDRYQEEVDDPKSRRTLLRYLKKMVNYDILEMQGSTSSATYKLAD